jgi:adenine phosphoribosyltransferase
MTEHLRRLVRTIPDYPLPGIRFRDITTLLRDPNGFREVVDLLVGRYRGRGITMVAGIEARGFILGGAVAHGLGAGFVPVRKRGKLPAQTIGQDYILEYGTDRVEMHADAVGSADRVLLVDDLIATGGTALAATHLLQAVGAQVEEACFVIELPDLGGGGRLRTAGVGAFSLLQFPGH